MNFSSPGKAGAQRPNRRLSNTLRQSHANLNQKEMAKRYTGMVHNEQQKQQTQLDISSAVAECKSCFTENYLVFSLNEKLPQETRHYLDKEDDVLDYCKTVNFNRNARRLEHAQGLFDQGSASTSNMPDEIDGDDRLGVSRSSSIYTSSLDSAKFQNTRKDDESFSMDESMYIGEEEGVEDSQRMRRYSVIGNDPSFKQYTKNHDYNELKYQQQRKVEEELEESILTVSLKDLTLPNSSHDSMTSGQFGIGGGPLDQDDEDEDTGREQYRVIKKDLLFKVNFQQNNNKYRHGENQVVSERTLSDFRKLGASLQKLFPGCYVPIIPKQSTSIDLPQSIFDFRKTPMECAQVENFCRKLRNCQYLLESDCVQLFMDPRIFQVQLDGQVSNLVKQTSTQADTLNRFKQGFNSLSGKQVDSQTFLKIEKFRTFIAESQKHLLRFRSLVEKAMTNKVEYDNNKVKLFQSMADLEEFIAADLADNRYSNRSEQRVLDKYAEVNNDTHWRALEATDDFIRDQLADCQALCECFHEIAKAQVKLSQVKQTLDSRTQHFISQEKKQVPLAKVKQARAELDQTEVSYYEANLCYNIMIINMAYVTIEQFKQEKRQSFLQIMRTICQTRIVQENEMHGFFKFVLNFYDTDF